MNLSKTLFLISSLTVCSSTYTQTLMNRSDAGWATLDQCFAAAITEKVFPGAVALVMHRGKVVYHKAFGRYTYEPNAPRMKHTTLFDLASLTKILVTTPIALMLCDIGLLELDTPVVHYLPAFAVHNKDTIQVQHLLTHSSGLDAGVAFYPPNTLPEAVLNKIIADPLAHPTGTYKYSDIGMVILQHIIETSIQAPLDRLFNLLVAKPLGLKDTCFKPRDKSRCAPTRCLAPDREPCIQGTVDDDKAYRLGEVAGHAGLFGTAAEVATIMQCFLNQGSYTTTEGTKQQLINPQTIALAQKDWHGHRRGLGFELGRFLSPVAFGHMGWTGTSAWADPKNQIVCVLLTNRVHPKDRGIEKIKNFRLIFHGLASKILVSPTPETTTPQYL